MSAPARAPLEGDRISSTGPTLPDFLAPLEHKFFVTPRWRVRVFVDCPSVGHATVLVKIHEWIAAPDVEAAIEAVKAYGYTDAVRYEGTLVEEAPAKD